MTEKAILSLHMKELSHDELFKGNKSKKEGLPSAKELIDKLIPYIDTSGWDDEGQETPEEVMRQNEQVRETNDRTLKDFMVRFGEEQMKEALSTAETRMDALSSIDTFLRRIPRIPNTEFAQKVFVENLEKSVYSKRISCGDFENNLTKEQLREEARIKLHIYNELTAQLNEKLSSDEFSFIWDDVKKSMSRADMGNFILESEIKGDRRMIRPLLTLACEQAMGRKHFDKDYLDTLATYLLPTINHERDYIGEPDDTALGRLVGQVYTKKISNEYGIRASEASQLIYVWKNQKHQSVRKNLETMSSVEKEIPGGVKKLSEYYNIQYFSRYPTELLKTQLTEEDVQQPYGVIIYAKDDYNGAFTTDKPILKSLFKDTRGHHALKIFEVSSKSDVARTLIKCNQKYGAQNKISFVVFSAHGEEYAMQLGSNDSANAELSKSDINIRKPGKDHFFEEKPVFVLMSCSTGTENVSIGERISEIYNATVFAPKTDTGIKLLHVTYGESNTPDFDIQYDDESAHRVIKRAK